MRPIIWAFAVLAAVASWALGASDRLANSIRPSEPSRATVEAGGDPQVLTVSADLQGHFLVHPTLDGRRIRMLVDTGASFVALSYQDAALAGIRVEPKDFTRRVATANGTTGAAPVRIREMRIGEITVRNVDAVVLPRGSLGTSLLGMSFLKRLGGFEVSKGQLTLRG